MNPSTRSSKERKWPSLEFQEHSPQCTCWLVLQNIEYSCVWYVFLFSTISLSCVCVCVNRCTGNHLPGYVQNADAFKSKGIDEIVCLTVNDPAVSSAWANHVVRTLNIL